MPWRCDAGGIEAHELRSQAASSPGGNPQGRSRSHSSSCACWRGKLRAKGLSGDQARITSRHLTPIRRSGHDGRHRIPPRRPTLLGLRGCRLRTVRRWIADEIIPSTKLGGARLVAMGDLESLLSASGSTEQEPTDNQEYDEESRVMSTYRESSVQEHVPCML